MHLKYIFSCEQISVRLTGFFFHDNVLEGILTISKIKLIALESWGLNRFQEHVIMPTISNVDLKKEKVPRI